MIYWSLGWYFLTTVGVFLQTLKLKQSLVLRAVMVCNVWAKQSPKGAAKLTNECDGALRCPAVLC